MFHALQVIISKHIRYFDGQTVCPEYVETPNDTFSGQNQFLSWKWRCPLHIKCIHIINDVTPKSLKATLTYA